MLVSGWHIAASEKEMYSYGVFPDESERLYLADFTFNNYNIKIRSPESNDIPECKGIKINNPYPPSYIRIICSKSRKYKIEPSLVYAMIKVESNWDSRALSRKGAKGLMQLMPSTVKEMNINDPFDPEENIEGGTRYLRYLLNKFHGDISLALAAYNAGPGKIKKYNGIPPIKETKHYVKRILTIYSEQNLPDNRYTPEI